MALNAVEQARQTILDVLDAQVGLLPPWRYHKYPPRQVAAPCVWIDMPALSRADLFLDSAWPVVLVVDGSDQAQMAAMDVAVAVLWDALDRVDGMAVAEATAVIRDVGGPSLRAVQLTVSVALTVDTLCPSPLSDLTLTP